MRDPSQSADAARRVFLLLQACFIGYVVAEVIIAELAHLRATENTSSIAMKGDTAVTANWPLTLAWAILVLLTYAVKKPFARCLFAVLATLYVVTITAGNSSEVFAKKQQFTGWKWSLVLALDAVAAIFTVLCIVAAFNWGRRALKARQSDAVETSPQMEVG